MKKFLLFIFSIVMAFSLFGCVKDTDDEQPSSGYETESDETGTNNDDVGDESNTDGVNNGNETDSGNEDNEEETSGNSTVMPPIFNGGSFG